MKKNIFVAFLCLITISIYSQTNLNKFAFSQQYKELLIHNCDTPPANSIYMPLNNDGITKASSLIFTKIDIDFFNKIKSDIVID